MIITKSDCKYYNWGNGYPREYGARCDKHELFFMRTNGKLSPDCKECKHYGRRESP